MDEMKLTRFPQRKVEQAIAAHGKSLETVADAGGLVS
jgi:hypothetical protein